jgi:omega-hydroxy-beta-dihydromenaquinone-9 sulfotransferase
VTTASEPVKSRKVSEGTTGKKFQAWHARFWDGMTTMPWFSLLIRNRFQISPWRWSMAFLICFIALFNSFLAVLQAIVLTGRIRRTKLADDPIFILGHWRSGTTLLHELLVLDPRHTYPTTYECFAPNHFLVSGDVIPWLLPFLIPGQRPMDNMASGWGHPQEDEFALCNMGLPSPYLTVAFPNRPPQCGEYLTLRRVEPAARERWKSGLVWFLKCLTVRRNQRIVLKSPAHTARVRTLLEMFPNARFVHIVRDPVVLFASTVNLWKRLYRDHGLQMPTFAGLEEYVFAVLAEMYEAFEEDRALIPAGHYAEVRYEDLIRDLPGQMRKLYADMGLDGFEQIRPAIEKYASGQKDYQANRWVIAPEVRAEIAQRWRSYFERYGYEPSGA